MKAKTVFLAFSPFLVLIAFILLASLAKSAGKKPEVKEEAELKPVVEVREALRQSVQFDVTAQGTLTPKTKTSLVTEVSGKILSVSDKFVTGGFFSKGDLLLKIDPSNYQTDLQSALAELARSESAFRQEKARADQARKDWDAIGSSNQPNDLVLRIPQLMEAEANVKAAKANVERAKRNLDRTQIRAPYNGLVKSKSADVGQYITTGTPLGEIYGTDVGEVRLPITASDLKYLNLPAPSSEAVGPEVVLIKSTGNDRQTWPAQIVRSEGVVDESNRVTYLVAQINDPYQLQSDNSTPPLSYGTFLKVVVQGKNAEDLLVVPQSSLINQRQIVVLGEGNTLDIRDVEIIRNQGSDAIIQADIVTGERIVLSALENPLNGTEVEPKESDTITITGTPEGAVQ